MAVAEQIIIPLFLGHSRQCARFIEFMIGKQNIPWRPFCGVWLFSHCEASPVHFFNTVPARLHRKQSRVDPCLDCERLANVGSDKIYCDHGGGIEIERSRDGGIDGEPRPSRSAHFVQLALHDAKLALKREILEGTYKDCDDGKYGDPDSRRGRSAGRTILGGFLLVLSAALMKVAFHFEDTPRPQRNDWWLTWGRESLPLR